MRWTKRISTLYITIIIVFSLLLISGCAAPQQTTTPTEGPELSGEKAFIWEITSDVSTVYLLGSIHVASNDIYPLNSAIEDAFQAANNLVVEIDISKVNPLTTAELMMEYGFYLEGKNLKSSVSEELYIKLDDYFTEYGIDISTMDMFRPWVIDTLMEELRLESMGYYVQNGIDMYFIKKAAETDKNILELETTEFQMKLLSSFSDEIMILAIQYSFQDPPTKEMIEKLFYSWENGNTDAVESLIFDGLNEDPVFDTCYQVIYIDRNYSMADKIELFLSEKDVYFVVVGAAHLVGEDGLISILENRGYEIRQLSQR